MELLVVEVNHLEIVIVRALRKMCPWKKSMIGNDKKEKTATVGATIKPAYFFHFRDNQPPTTNTR